MDSLISKAGLLTYASFTSVYPKDDPRRFHLGTPPQLLASIERTWRVTPTSKRIVKDIELLPDVLGKVIDAIKPPGRRQRPVGSESPQAPAPDGGNGFHGTAHRSHN